MSGMRMSKIKSPFNLGSLLRLLLLLVGYLLLTFSQPAFAQTISNLAADPQGGIGFNRAHWAMSIKKMIVAFGTSGAGAFGDNSIRALDPVTNSWEYLFPNNNGSSGLQNRDNHGSLYVNQLDEFWVWGGSHLETLPPGTALRSGRFSISKKQWVATALTDGGAFAGVVKNFGGGLIDSAMDWSAQANMGLIFGGSEQGNQSNRYWIIEANPAGPEPYKMSEIIGGTRPPVRDHVEQNLVALGPDFYLFGGAYQDPTDLQYKARTDLWKFSSQTRTWTQLADAPGPLAGSARVSADIDRNAVVAWAGARLLVYSISLDTWSDQTPAGLPFLNNHLGVYSPTAKIHVYDGGNKQDGGSSFGVYGIKLDGLVTPPPALPPLVPPPPSGGFDIPVRTWVARQWTTGNAPGIGGAKHLRLMQNPVNGRIYFDGGDIAGSFQANTQAFFSLDIPTNQWFEEYPSCGRQGDIIHGGPDEVGFVYDTKRNLFWSMPGFYFVSQSGPGACGFQGGWNTATPTTFSGVANYPNGGFYFLFGPDGNRYTQGVDYQVTTNLAANTTTLTNLGTLPSTVTFYYARAGAAYGVTYTLVFNPVTKTWHEPNALLGKSNVHNHPWPGQSPKSAVYDPVTDTIFRAGDDQSGVNIYAYHIGTDTWTKHNTPCAIPDPGAYGSQGSCPAGTYYINDTGFGFEYLAGDIVNRKLYIIDVKHANLLQFDMDNPGTVRIKAQPPFPQSWLDAVRSAQIYPQDQNNIVWDSVNGVLLFPWLDGAHLDGYPQMFIYHPDTNTWETDPMFQPEGLTVRGNSFAFDAINNVLISIGGLKSGDLDPTVTRFFLYRYGTAAQPPTVQPPTVKLPNPPSNLILR